MAFPRQFLDELVSRCDIVDVVSSYVALQHKGSNYFGLCPFHNEKTGSFSVSPDKQIYYCFGCKRGGGVISFIMEIEGLSFPDAVRFLAKRVGMTVPEEEADREASRHRQRLLAVNKDAARWFYQNLSRPEGAAVAAYLERRKISRKTAMNFGLGASLDSWDSLLTAMLQKGYTKRELLDAGLVVQNQKGRLYDKFRNRLIFPVINVRGDVVAFGGRVLDKSEPKYLNTQETAVYSKRRNLYGINLAKRTKRPNFILCEGNIDVITLHQAGFDNAVASMGTALTTEQIRLLSRYTKELVLCYDNDGAGQAATEKAISLLENSEFNVRVLSSRMWTTSSSSRAPPPSRPSWTAARTRWTTAWTPWPPSTISATGRPRSPTPRRSPPSSPPSPTRWSGRSTPAGPPSGRGCPGTPCSWR